MNSKIKIYSIIIAIIYICSISYTIYESCNDLTRSFEQGYKQGYENRGDSRYKPSIFFAVDVRPVDGLLNFPDHEENLLTGESASVEANSLNICIQDQSQNVPTYLSVIQFVLYLLALLLLIGLIYIPFAYFKIIKSINRGELMVMKNVKRANKIGVVLILCSVTEILMRIVNTKIIQTQVRLSDYDIIYNIEFTHYAFFILGLVILILAEILRESLRMKEEQELTI